MKATIKRILSKFGFLIIRDRPDHLLTWRVNHIDNVEALELAILLCRKGRTSFKFIQIGANDGISADPLRQLVSKYHLEGILIEPLPDVYLKLKENYASEPQLEFANVAVGLIRKEEKNIYRFKVEGMKNNNNLQGLSTFDRARIEAHARNLCINLSDIETISVPCLPLIEIVNKYNYENFNFLCIDAEGMDFDICKSAFESNIKPEIIYIEILDMPAEQQHQLMRLLSQGGYRINATISDLLAIKLPSIASN